MMKTLCHVTCKYVCGRLCSTSTHKTSATEDKMNLMSTDVTKITSQYNWPESPLVFKFPTTPASHVIWSNVAVMCLSAFLNKSEFPGSQSSTRVPGNKSPRIRLFFVEVTWQDLIHIKTLSQVSICIKITWQQNENKQKCHRIHGTVKESWATSQCSG